jgi:rhodanese-related sulfurtransferase
MFASAVPEIDVADVADDAFLLDVRDLDEWTAGHASAALHIPMMEVPSRVDELPADRDVVVICRVGARSAQVVAYLRSHGRDRVANLAGGMYAWEAAGRSLVADEGRAPYVL